MDEQPKEITKDSESGVEYASFDYYPGIALAKKNGWKQTTSFADIDRQGHFLVCCGDVMIKVVPSDYPAIERRII